MKGTWLPLVVTLTIQAMVSMALLALPVMAPVVAQALGVSTTYTGLYVAVVYAGAMLASLSAGATVARRWRGLVPFASARPGWCCARRVWHCVLFRPWWRLRWVPY
jgi:hypothetical protein